MAQERKPEEAFEVRKACCGAFLRPMASRVSPPAFDLTSFVSYLLARLCAIFSAVHVYKRYTACWLP